MKRIKRVLAASLAGLVIVSAQPVFRIWAEPAETEAAQGDAGTEVEPETEPVELQPEEAALSQEGTKETEAVLEESSKGTEEMETVGEEVF
ncbi:MAG: hypothetical protein HFE83_10090 [Lachnospiraceae bacterium]|jgi:hypothetical protein|nr:hypothetical protein [Lachnospiraceae bacterium]